ncbi:hypothetical protein [Candidatus Liberibacter sp.]|nr:hypothetical protein [Candidatus Liberibacter sp.]
MISNHYGLEMMILMVNAIFYLKLMVMIMVMDVKNDDVFPYLLP